MTYDWSPDLFDVAFIPLTQGKFACVDLADLRALSAHKWFAVRLRGFYAHGTINGQQIGMHRLLAGVAPEIQVDHKDRDGLNNRRKNLRPCTPGQNNMNQRSRQGSGSRFKGVYWHKHRSRWAAQIDANRKRRSLGYFVVEADAARAYDRAAVVLHGEFAVLNFPQVQELQR